MYKLPLLQVLRLAFHGFAEVRQLADKGLQAGALLRVHFSLLINYVNNVFC